jgi:hypothetical protein
MKNIFTEEMLSGLEWTQVVSQNTADGIYRVDVRWQLDRYRIQVWRRVQEPEKFTYSIDAYYLRTAVKTANALLLAFERREAL